MQDGFRGSSLVGTGGCWPGGAQCPYLGCPALPKGQGAILPRSHPHHPVASAAAGSVLAMLCGRCSCSILGGITCTRSGGENGTRGLKKTNWVYGGTFCYAQEKSCVYLSSAAPGLAGSL